MRPKAAGEDGFGLATGVVLAAQAGFLGAITRVATRRVRFKFLLIWLMSYELMNVLRNVLWSIILW